MTGAQPSVTSPLPYLTADLPGVGGEIKRNNEDFRVEEIPKYQPCGDGTHTYLTIEKDGLTTLAAIRMIAKAIGKRPNDIGYAGLKDAHGITRQTFSVEHVDPERIRALEGGRIRILSVSRHTNKLKLGHLAGNRFLIKIRNAHGTQPQTAAAVVDVLRRRGVPNYFGPQRFGTRGDNAMIGRAVLRDNYNEAIALLLGRPLPSDRPDVRKARELFDEGDLNAAASAWPKGFGQQARVCRAMLRANGDARAAWRAVDHGLRKLYFSAVQSELFNQVLAERIETIDRLMTGDIAWKHVNGACFVVEDPTVEQPRCDRQEISPTGPLFGRKMTDARGEVGLAEARVLAASGLAREQLRAKDGTKLDGARRPLRVPLEDSDVDVGSDEHGPYLRLAFALPPGAYATNVTREVTKSD